MKSREKISWQLFNELEILIEQDLVDRKVEAKARALLNELSRQGIFYSRLDDDCLACLDLEMYAAFNQLKSQLKMH